MEIYYNGPMSQKTPPQGVCPIATVERPASAAIRIFLLGCPFASASPVSTALIRRATPFVSGMFSWAEPYCICVEGDDRADVDPDGPDGVVAALLFRLRDVEGSFT